MGRVIHLTKVTPGYTFLSGASREKPFKIPRYRLAVGGTEMTLRGFKFEGWAWIEQTVFS
jgi:hypothetical protein